MWYGARVAWRRALLMPGWLNWLMICSSRGPFTLEKATGNEPSSVQWKGRCTSKWCHLECWCIHWWATCTRHLYELYMLAKKSRADVANCRTPCAFARNENGRLGRPCPPTLNRLERKLSTNGKKWTAHQKNVYCSLSLPVIALSQSVSFPFSHSERERRTYARRIYPLGEQKMSSTRWQSENGLLLQADAAPSLSSMPADTLPVSQDSLPFTTATPQTGLLGARTLSKADPLCRWQFEKKSKCVCSKWAEECHQTTHLDEVYCLRAFGRHQIPLLLDQSLDHF